MFYFKFTRPVFLVAALSSYVLSATLAEEPQPPAQVAPVIAEGLVTPETEVDLASPSEGLFMEVVVKEGAFLEKGAPIARLNDEEVEIQLRLAELQSRQSDQDYESTKRLFEQNAASRDDMNRAMLMAKRAAAECDLLKIRLRDRTITSPVAGYVIRILKDPGESVQRLEKVAEIVSLQRKSIIVYLDAASFGKLRQGMKAEIDSSISGLADLSGAVEIIDPILDAGGTSYRIKILVEDPQNLLSAGTRVPVKILPQ